MEQLNDSLGKTHDVHSDGHSISESEDEADRATKLRT